jgi:hypothetical protein
VSRLPIRALWRAAACAALLAFAFLPHGHLRGHEEVAAARALAGSEAPALLAAASTGHADAHQRACPVCLSLARVRDALAAGSGVELGVLAAAASGPPASVPRQPEAPTSAHTAPRAPPLA